MNENHHSLFQNLLGGINFSSNCDHNTCCRNKHRHCKQNKCYHCKDTYHNYQNHTHCVHCTHCNHCGCKKPCCKSCEKPSCEKSCKFMYICATGYTGYTGAIGNTGYTGYTGYTGPSNSYISNITSSNEIFVNPIPTTIPQLTTTLSNLIIGAKYMIQYNFTTISTQNNCFINTTLFKDENNVVTNNCNEVTTTGNGLATSYTSNINVPIHISGYYIDTATSTIHTYSVHAITSNGTTIPSSNLSFITILRIS